MQEISVILFGSIVSYKTKIRKTFCKQQFSHSDIRIDPKQSYQYSQRIFEHQRKKISFKIWDTAYRGGHKSVSKFWKMGDCIIYVYEASRKQSFDDAIQFFNHKTKYPIRPVILVEYVLNSEKREIPQEKGFQFANANGLMFQQISDDYPQNIERMFERIATEITLWKGKNMLEKRDKDIYLSQILALQHEVRRLNQRIQEFEKFSQQGYKMYEKYKSLQFVCEQTKQKLQTCERLMKSIEIQEDIYDVVNLYEKENLALKERMTDIQDQFKQRQSKLMIRCKRLEEICDHLNTITIRNVTTKLEEMSLAYNQYKLINCNEQSIQMAEKEEEFDISRLQNMSKFLQELKNSPSVELSNSNEPQHLSLADSVKNT